MNNGILSQEEIDALLKGQGQSEPAESGHELTETEEDTLGEVGNICMGTSATTLSTLLGKKVRITTPVYDIPPAVNCAANIPCRFWWSRFNIVRG